MNQLRQAVKNHLSPKTISPFFSAVNLAENTTLRHCELSLCLWTPSLDESKLVSGVTCATLSGKIMRENFLSRKCAQKKFRSGRYCCFHEVSKSAIILLQIPILITCENVTSAVDDYKHQV